MVEEWLQNIIKEWYKKRGKSTITELNEAGKDLSSEGVMITLEGRELLDLIQHILSEL